MKGGRNLIPYMLALPEEGIHEDSYSKLFYSLLFLWQTLLQKG